MVVECRSISKIRDKNGVTTGYVLADASGNNMHVPSNEIKAAIKSGKVIVSNLKLTKDNKLINDDIDIPRAFNALLDTIASSASVEYEKPRVNEFTISSKIKNTVYSLVSNLDVSLFKLCDNTTNTYTDINDKKSVESAIALLSNIKNGRVITLNTSDIYKLSSKKLAETLGIKCVGGYFNIDEPESTLIIIVNDGNGLRLKDTKLKAIKVIAASYNAYQAIDLFNCTIGIVESTKANINLVNSIITDYIKTSRCSVVPSALSYINNAFICDTNTATLTHLVCNSFYCENVDIIKCSGTAYIHNCKAVHSINKILIVATGLCMDNIEIESKDTVMKVNNHNMNVMKEFKEELSDIDDCEIKSKLIEILSAGFIVYSDHTVNIKSKSTIRTRTLFCRCNVSPKIELITEEEYRLLVNAEFIQDNLVEDLILYGGIAITDNTDIVFKNLIIPSYGKDNKHKNKDYVLAEGGIFLLDNKVNNFSITIENDIRAEGKNSEYDLGLVLDGLATISKIKPIKVYFNTPAYRILLSRGVALDIIDKESIPDKLSKVVMKEKMLGINSLDKIHEAVKEALSSVNLAGRYELNTGCMVEIPEKIVKGFGIKLKPTSINTYNSTEYSILKLLMKLPLNNLPFTTEVFNAINNNTKYVVDCYLLYSGDNVVVSRLDIAYHGILKIDSYVIVSNGKNLIYMTFIGNYKLFCGKSTPDTKFALSQLSKLEQIDFEQSVIKQNITLQTISNITEFIRVTRILINDTNTYILGGKDAVYSTVGDNEEILEFNCKCNKLALSGFDVTYNNEASLEIPSKVLCMDSIKTEYSYVNNLKEQFNDSLLLQLKQNNILNRLEEDDDSNYIKEAKASSIWQLAQDYKNEVINSRHSSIPFGLIEAILEFPVYNEITHEDFKKVLKKSSLNTNIGFITDSYYKINEFRFDGRFKKYENEFMGSIEWVYQIVLPSGEIMYYTTDLRLHEVMLILKSIASSNSEEAYENTLEYFKILRDIVIERNDNDKSLGYDEISHDFDILDAEYSKTVIVKTNRRISADEIYKMTPTQQNLDKLGSDMERFLDFKKKYSLHLALNKLTDRGLYTEIYKTKSALTGRHKGYGSRLALVICNKTGRIYLISLNNSYRLFLFRIPSLLDAFILRKQLILESGSSVRNISGLFQDCGWYQSGDLINTINNQLDNVKERNRYPKKYIHLLAYASEEPPVEASVDIGEASIKESNNTKNVMLKNYSNSYIMQYINMGALRLIPSIPKEYIFNKKLLTSNSNITISEYCNFNKDKFAYEVSDGTKFVSEYSLEELLDL